MSYKAKEEFMEELKERFPYNDIEIIQYMGASKPIAYKCKTCNQKYYKSRANHLYENKTLCQKCYSAKESEIRNKFKNIVRNSQFNVLSAIGAISNPVILQCKQCGREIKVFQYNFVLEKAKRECPQCGRFSLKTKEDFIYRMKERTKDYKILEYKNYTTKVKFQHKCGFVFTQLPSNFLKGRGCPKCFKKISKGEQYIMNWLEEHHIKYEYQKKFPETKLKSFDFYLPEQNILIEYQGEQHYHPLNCFGGKEKFQLQQERDSIKREFAKNNQINLIEIPYYDNIEKYLLPIEGSTTSLKDVESSDSKENCK